MNIENIQKLSFIFFILAAVFFLISVVMFFSFKVPKLFNELTGIAANKEIKNISFKSSKSGSGILHTGKKRPENIMTLSGNLKTPSDMYEFRSDDTRKLKTKELKEREEELNETTVLVSNNKIGNADKTHSTNNYVVPVTKPDAAYKIIYKEDYMSSSEIIS